MYTLRAGTICQHRAPGCHRQVFFSRITTSRSGLPVMGSLYFAHTPYTLHRSRDFGLPCVFRSM
jgi:hypothetical protein